MAERERYLQQSCHPVGSAEAVREAGIRETLGLNPQLDYDQAARLWSAWWAWWAQTHRKPRSKVTLDAGDDDG